MTITAIANNNKSSVVCLCSKLVTHAWEGFDSSALQLAGLGCDFISISSAIHSHLCHSGIFSSHTTVLSHLVI